MLGSSHFYFFEGESFATLTRHNAPNKDLFAHIDTCVLNHIQLQKSNWCAVQSQGVLLARAFSITLSEAMNALRTSFAENFSYTSARHAHLFYLLSDANLELYNPLDFLAAVLPLYIYYYHEEIRLYYSGTWDAEPVFADVIVSLICVYFILYFFHMLYGIELVFGTPGLSGKLLCAIDLWIKSVMVYSFQGFFAISVKAVLDHFFGWPTVRGIWYQIRHDFDEIWEEEQQ